MAWTNVGYDGTINESEWATLSGLLGNSYVAAGDSDCLATAVGGSRAVSVAAGSLYGDGVLSTNSAPETVAMTTPVNGQWYVIALRRTWATNTAALVAIAGATTSTTTPTAPPTSFPTLNTNKGVLTDQPIAWAWCNSANTTVVVYDIRLKAVKSLPPVVANQGERDAKFMTPSQGLQVWRDDLGAVETYFGLYNVSTNPGGRSTAGWYQGSKGRILQTVTSTYSTEVTTGSTSYVTTGITGTITPTSATSKILILVSGTLFQNDERCYPIATVFRGTVAGTDLAPNAYGLAMGRNNVTAATFNTVSYGINVSDSPASTSALTYTVGIKASASTSIVKSQYLGSTASMTIMEVAN